jgi:CRISPR-associated protein Cas1
MRQHHNVLYITTPKAYLHKRDEAVEVVRKGLPPARVPLHHLNSIVCFGPVSVSPYLAFACAGLGIAVSFLSEQGRFLAQLVGPQNGNVLLRRAQYRAADDRERCTAVARTMVLGKVANCRTVLRRGAREVTEAAAVNALSTVADRLTDLLGRVKVCEELDSLRGLEGAAAAQYFGAFPHLLRGDEGFAWNGRRSRPATDRVNSVLGFLYALLGANCNAAAQAVGLDAQVGFLHVEKPGRPALQLDLMEEFRPIFADRLLFALVNRRQLKERHFERQASAAVLMTEEGRKLLITEYQNRRREEIQHPFTRETTEYSILPLIQARLLARHLRGDLDAYVPFVLS